MFETIAIVAAVVPFAAESVYTAVRIAHEVDTYPSCPADVDPSEWRAFIDGIPPFDAMTEAELDAMAKAYGE